MNSALPFYSPILDYAAGNLVWAHDDLQTLLGNIAEIVVCILSAFAYQIQGWLHQYVDSPDRKSFLADFGPGRKYENAVGIYRENESAAKIGVFDKALIDSLPPSVRWIAHNGAGYDPVDVYACMAKGRHPVSREVYITSSLKQEYTFQIPRGP